LKKKQQTIFFSNYTDMKLTGLQHRVKNSFANGKQIFWNFIIESMLINLFDIFEL